MSRGQLPLIIGKMTQGQTNQRQLGIEGSRAKAAKEEPKSKKILSKFWEVYTECNSCVTRIKKRGESTEVRLSPMAIIGHKVRYQL